MDKLISVKLAFASKNFITDHQHGFTARRSTVTNLLCYQHDILQSFESGQAVHAIYTDVAKAFDRVNVSFLIAKLRSFGIGDCFLLWLSSYLNGRSQQVRIGNAISSSIEVSSGVGQGSHMGPLLFSIFFNDLPLFIKYSSILMFADDVKIYKSIASIHDCLLLQRDLDCFFNWLETNGMELSVHKCAVMEFCRVKKSHIFNYQINSFSLPYVNEIKDLGIFLDKTFSLTFHIDKLSMKCHRILGYIHRNSRGLSSEAFCVLFKALVRSLLEYASNVWSPHYDVHINSLERVQKRFLRCLHYRHPLSSVSLPLLSERRDISDVNFFVKLINNNVDCPKLLGLVGWDCHRRLRGNKTYFINSCRTNYSHFSPINKMMRMMNQP
ncbi:hypothetical protein M8J77_014623 [Diaphorina citri]|nr:hypothetical protein M8J77_014623 [Diaphorina citri]